VRFPLEICSSRTSFPLIPVFVFEFLVFSFLVRRLYKLTTVFVVLVVVFERDS